MILNQLYTKEKYLLLGKKLLILLKVGQNSKDLNIIYSHIECKSDGTFRKCTIKCEYQGSYSTKSSGKQTTTKRIGCTWHINLSEPSINNPSKHIYLITFYDTHSHDLDPNIVKFGDNKRLPPEIMKEIEFLTISCKMGATT